VRGPIVLFAAAALTVAGAASGAPRPCPATCIHVGSHLNPARASAPVGAPIGFLAVDGRRHRIRSAFFSVTAVRGKNPPVVRLSAGSYGYRDAAGAGAGRVLVLPSVKLRNRVLQATWGARGTPGRSWRVWLSTNGGPRKVWLAKTSAWTGGIVLPRTAREACVTAATAGAAPSPAACAGRAAAAPGSGLSYRELVLAAHPSAFWPFAADETDVAGTHRLTLAGGAAVAGAGIEGAGDRALTLSGSGQYGSSPFAADLNPRRFTVEAWARADGGAGTARKVLVERDPAGMSGLILEATAKDSWKAWLGHGSKSWDAITGPGVVRGHWTHLLLAYDGASGTLYVDGAKAGSVFTPFRPNDSGALGLGVGRSAAGTPAFFFDGLLDDVAVYPHALTAADVAAHYAAAKGRS